MNLAELLKDSAYKLTQFKPAQIAALEAGITLKKTDKASTPYVTCLVRGKPIKLTPEEAVRQLYVMVLKDDLGYPFVSQRGEPIWLATAPWLMSGVCTTPAALRQF